MSKLFGFRYEKKEQPETEEMQDAASNVEAEIDTKGETETFFTRNVRMLTFLICVAVFLAVFGPMSIFQINSCVEEKMSAGDAMTVEDVRTFAARRGQLKLSDFEDYAKEESEGDDVILYTISVEGDYLVMVGARDEDAALHYFTVTNIKTDETVDVMATTYSQSLLDGLLGR